MNFLESESDRQVGDFYSVSFAELEVFNLDPALVADLAMAHLRFQHMVGEASSGHNEEEQAQRDRILWNTYFTFEDDGEISYEPEQAVRFMVEVCELPVDQAHAWLARLDAQYWRDGLYVVSEDEASSKYLTRMRSRTNKITAAVASPKGIEL